MRWSFHCLRRRHCEAGVRPSSIGLFNSPRPNAFFVETESKGEKLTVAGAIGEDRSWQIERLTVADANGAQSYRELNQVPDPYRKRFEQLTENRGLEITGLFGYVKDHGKLPPVDWAILAAFIGIAGAGGMTNTLFSNYARDKGWGMGKHVGAIPSAIGGRMIKLSHVGYGGLNKCGQ